MHHTTGKSMTTDAPPRAAYCFERMSLDADAPARYDRETRRLLNLLNYTKTSGTEYAATLWQAGYHAITLNGRRFAGQRDPRERLASVPFDFAGKTVLDIGCNQGGMLLELRDRIGRGVGIDYDSRMVNAANAVRSSLGAGNLDFYVFNLEEEDLDVIRDLLPAGTVDIAFLLSVCKWIRNWREVIDFARGIADALLYESNGAEAHQREQVACLRQTYGEVELISDGSPDDYDPKHMRRLYLCR